MARMRRWWWLLVPALGIAGAFWLPSPDEFAFLGKESHVEPAVAGGMAEAIREWDLREPPEVVLGRLRARLNARTGWGEILMGSLSSSRLPGKGRLTDKSAIFGNVDTGGLASFIAYDGEPSRRTCAVVVSERRNGWGRVRHWARRVFGR